MRLLIARIFILFYSCEYVSRWFFRFDYSDSGREFCRIQYILDYMTYYNLNGQIQNNMAEIYEDVKKHIMANHLNPHCVKLVLGQQYDLTPDGKLSVKHQTHWPTELHHNTQSWHAHPAQDSRLLAWPMANISKPHWIYLISLVLNSIYMHSSWDKYDSKT